MRSKTFCIAPWVHASVRPDTTMRPCCYSSLESKVGFTEYEEWWNGASMKQLRQDLWTGVQSPSCQQCWQDESVGKDSLRKNYNNMLSKFADFDSIKNSVNNDFISSTPPTTWDLQIGNLCNLKCVMCNPGLSHQIATEQERYKDTIEKIFPIALSHNSLLNWSDTPESSEFFKKINQDTLWLKLQGGEPLSVKNIKGLIENMQPESVLSITTNGTVLTESLLETFSKIKHIEISISVECAGPENDIIRYGSDWTEIDNNIQLLKKLPNVSLQINHVMQITSVFFLPDLIEFCERYNLHLNIILLQQPEYLSLSACLPKYIVSMHEQIDSLIIQHPKNQYIKPLIETLLKEVKFNNLHWEQFIQYVKMLDSIREKKYSSILKFKELCDI